MEYDAILYPVDKWGNPFEDSIQSRIADPGVGARLLSNWLPHPGDTIWLSVLPSDTGKRIILTYKVVRLGYWAVDRRSVISKRVDNRVALYVRRIETKETNVGKNS
jgi:hypothetical protein